MKKEDIKKVVLAYSGGLDTSIIIPWLKENYNNCEVVAVSGDVGQGTELDGLEEKAIKTGASKLYIEDLTESLEMHYFTFTQEFNHIAYVRIVADSEDVVIGSSGFLLRRKIFVNISERIGFALDVCGGKRHTAGIGWVNRICVIHIICAYSVSVKALCALACCELGYYRAYHFEMG